jgi:hypothetical protein
MGAMKDIATAKKLAAEANGATAQAEVSTPAEIAAEEQFLTDAEQRIRSHGKRAVEAIVEIGRELAAVKAKFGEHRDGRYTKFVTKRLGWSLDSATNFTNVYRLSQSPKISDFSGLTISASSLYLIAAPSTPNPVRDEVLAKAATAEGVTHAEVKAAVAATKPPKPAAPKPSAEPADPLDEKACRAALAAYKLKLLRRGDGFMIHNPETGHNVAGEEGEYLQGKWQEWDHKTYALTLDNVRAIVAGIPEGRVVPGRRDCVDSASARG